MELIERVSCSPKTTSWIWGGFTTDIHIGRILREHDDLDYLTLNLRPLMGRFEETFSSDGWQIANLANGDLCIKKEGVKMHLGHIELDQVARWTHHGEKGSLLFPIAWLDPEAIEFYEMDVHVVAPELQYVLKEHPELLNPDWLIREKDVLEKECLRAILLKKGIDLCSLHKLVTSM